MKKRYRIVADTYCGYEVQYKLPWWPFWLQCGSDGGWGTNTHGSLEKAEAFAVYHQRPVLKDLGYL